MRFRTLTLNFLTPSTLLEKLSKSSRPPLCEASSAVPITSGRCESRKLYVPKHPVHVPENCKRFALPAEAQCRPCGREAEGTAGEDVVGTSIVTRWCGGVFREIHGALLGFSRGSRGGLGGSASDLVALGGRLICWLAVWLLGWLVG